MQCGVAAYECLLSDQQFYFWGHMKDVVYRNDVKNEDYLHERIFATAAEIRSRPEILQIVQDN